MRSEAQILSPRPIFSSRRSLLMAIILVTNDDGVHAAGLAGLAAELAELGEVWVIAPEREQSACGHALTLHRPLKADKVRQRWFAVNGTPSDCVNLGVLGFLPERPALVASGINHGSNLADDVTYSGTVSAAMEGTLLGVPSMAVSLLPGGDIGEAGRVARLVATRLLVEGLPRQTLLNINVPVGVPKGLRVARLGHRVYDGKIVEHTDPRGRTFYWIGGGDPQWHEPEGTDMAAVDEGYVSLTPLHLDLTHHRALAAMADWSSALSIQMRRDAARPRARSEAPPLDK